MIFLDIDKILLDIDQFPRCRVAVLCRRIVAKFFLDIELTLLDIDQVLVDIDLLFVDIELLFSSVLLLSDLWLA